MGTAKIDPVQYRSLVGSLLYLSHTQPDICYAISSVSRYMQAPEVAHYQASKKILRYLQGADDYGLLLSPNPKNELNSYADADWGRDVDTRRSVSGILHQFGNSTVGWSSKLQPTVSLSTTKAEYRVLTDAAKDIVHLRRLLHELGFITTKPTNLLSDNQSCIKLVCNPVLHARTKHIEIQHHFIRETTRAGEIQVDYTSTTSQLADFLTKPLPLKPFCQARNQVGVIPKPQI